MFKDFLTYFNKNYNHLFPYTKKNLFLQPQKVYFMKNIFLKKRVSKSLGFVFKKMGDEGILVQITQNVVNMDKVYTLNELGSFIYHYIDEPKEVNFLLNEIIKEFEVTPEVAEKDLEYFLNDAAKMGIIIVE